MTARKTIHGIVWTLLLASGAHAGLVNSDFEGGLDGWSGGPGGRVSAFTDVAGTYALFQEPREPGGAFVSAIHQDFEIGPQDLALSFEYMLLTSGEYTGDGALPDAFTARLLDPVTLQPLISTTGVSDFFYHDARGESDSIDYDDAWVTRGLIASRPDWFTVSLDITGLAVGTAARLQFRLLGLSDVDDQETYAGVDDVTIHLIPEPQSGFLLFVGVMLMRRRARRRAVRY